MISGIGRYLGVACAMGLSLTLPSSALVSQESDDLAALADNGFSTDQDRDPKWYAADHRRMAAAVAGLKPQKKGKIDVYVVVAGIDSDPVFGRETIETAKVLSARYGAQGKTITIAAGDRGEKDMVPHGSVQNLVTALGAVANKMDVNEDVLVLYTTSHGGPGVGIMYKDSGHGFGLISPSRMAVVLNGLGFKRKLVMVSACYSGAFVPLLENKDSVVITAASSERSSFGCTPGNDWTFFGDALINNALRNPVPLDAAVKNAFGLIDGWEKQKELSPSSEPQFSLGENAKGWLKTVEMAMPKTASAKVGKPAVEE